MAKKVTCEAPTCRITSKGRECMVMTPNWGGEGCRERKKSEFDPRGFFTKRSGKGIITIGCLKGEYDADKRRCKKGTRAYKIFIPKKG